MKVNVGDVVQMATGEILKFEEVDPDGRFTARLKGLQGEWTEFRLQGDSIKLPMFLKQQKAKLLDANEHPEPKEST